MQPPSGIPAISIINSTITTRNVTITNNVTNITQASTPILKELLQNLQPVDTAAYDSYASRVEQCSRGTRTKLLEEIWDWIDDNGGRASIYVLDGVAGIGKSTVAQTIAHKAAMTGLLGASYFFSRDDAERQTTHRFIPTIAYQLAKHDHALACRIGAAVKEHPDIAQKNLRQQFNILVLQPLQTLYSQQSTHARSLQRAPNAIPSRPVPLYGQSRDLTPILVVIDALDECNVEEAQALLKLIAEGSQSLPHLRILITARPELHIRRILDLHKHHELFHLHEIDESVVQADIRLYLTSRLSTDEVQRMIPEVRLSWQLTEAQMKMLCGICGSLFIIASTTVKYILDDRDFNPGRQLLRLLDGVSPEGFSGSRLETMDKIYIHLLLSAIPDEDDLSCDEDRWINRYQAIIGAIITLHHPLPCQALAGLLNIEDTSIKATLSHLHSLVAPGGAEYVFRVHHKTFPDFITDERRINNALQRLANRNHLDAKSLLIDTAVHHSRLAERCFSLMRERLTKNVANLPDREVYKDKSEVQHLASWQAVVSTDSELAYACTQWAYHLDAGSKRRGLDDKLRESLDNWQSSQLLAWLEMLSIFGKIDSADYILETASTTISTMPGSWTRATRILQLLNDARKLVARNMDILRLSSMHMYWSILPFIPANTKVYDTYIHAGNGVKVVSGAEEDWGFVIAILEGHSDAVLSVAFSHDGSRLASGSRDKTVRLWNGKTGAHIATLEGHSDRVNSVAFSSDGSRLASGSNDKTVRLWDGRTGEYVSTLDGHSDWVRSLSFSGDGSRLASASDDMTVRLWDGKTGVHLATLEGHLRPVNMAALSTDGSRLASASDDKTVRLWDGGTGAHIATFKEHTATILSVAFSNDGSRLASASCDKTVRLWDGDKGAPIAILEGHSDYVSSVTFSCDGSRLVSASYDKTVRLWDGGTGAHIATLAGHSNYVKSVTFSSDGSRIALASWDATVRLWDGKTGAPIATLRGHSRDVNSVAFSDDGSRLASASDDRRVRLWDANMNAPLSIAEDHASPVNSIVFSMDGSKLASASNDKTVRIWNGKTRAHIATLKGHSQAVKTVAFSNDGSRLATASEEEILRLWDPNTGVCIANLDEHTDSVGAVSFSPDGSKLASASDDDTVQLWDGKTGRNIAYLEPNYAADVNTVAFSSDGLTLASGGYDGTIRLWDSSGRKGSPIAIIKGHSDQVNSIAFSSNSPRFASASNDSTIMLWDGSPRNCGATLKGHSEAVTFIAFSKEGSRLASISHDNTIRLWDGSTGAHIYTFTRDATRICAIGWAYMPTSFRLARATPQQAHGTCLFALVERERPRISGLVVIVEHMDHRWDSIPFLWLPSHLEASAFAVDNTGSFIAVGCKTGKILLLDTTDVRFPYPVNPS